MGNDATEQLGLAVLVEERPRRPLPEPSTLRFQPLRAGILNVWQYEDQEFRFHQGRLILRGENGTGKSKALEVLLPFLLDADLSPHRLDPFAGTARHMHWNLIEDGRHESRLGYVWLELGRRDQDGEARYVTLGCGLRATRRTKRVDSWYFVAEQRRLGEDFHLLTRGRQPLMREQLRAELGDGGTVFSQAAEYRERVDALLYDLGSDRFAALRHLLLQLRRPHLSEKLNPQSLSDLLRESLPPVDADLVRQLSEGFKRLADEEKELVRLREASATVTSFLDVYREYGRGVARARAAEVRRGESRYHKKAAQLRESEDERQKVEDEIAELGERTAELVREIDSARGTVRALEQSEAMQAAIALATKEEHARTLEEQAARDTDDDERLARAARERTGEHEDAAATAERDRRRLAEPERRAAEAAAAAGLEAVHAGAAEVLAEDAGTRHSDARATVRAAADERREAAGELRGLLEERGRAEARFRHADDRRREAAEQVRAAHERHRDAEAAVGEELERLDEAIRAWADGLAELRLTDDELERVRAAPDDEAEDALENALRELLNGRRDVLVRERLELEHEIAAVHEERDGVAEERRRVEEAAELGPQPPPTRRSEREGRSGAPFYLLCDFAEGTSEDERAGLEAALEGAGLLDAWVTPEGRLLDPDTLDTVLVPRPVAAGLTLADVLAATGDAVDRDVLKKIFLSVAVEDDDCDVRVGVDGSWQLGPLAGRFTKDVAEHIGAGAREAARRRRLAELDTRLAELDVRLAELARAADALGERLERLAAEGREAPHTAELRRLRHAASATASDLARRRAELTEAEGAVAAARRERDDARRQVETRAVELRLQAHVDDLDGYLDQLRLYEVRFADLIRVHLAAQASQRAAERARALAEEARTASAEASRRAAASRGAALRTRAELEELKATVGVEAREIVERHRAAVERRDRLEEGREALRETETEARERRSAVGARLELLAEELAVLAEERERANERFRRLAEQGFLALVHPEEAVADAASWSATRTIEVARAVETRTADVDLSQQAADRRTDRLHRRYQELATNLGGDFQPRVDHDEELQIVRIGHQQRDYDVPDLLSMLGEEIETRKSLLAEHERDLLRRFLLGEVGDHLRGRLREAHGLVDRMNGLLESCRTASGLTLKLAWRPDDDADPRVRQVVKLLRQDPELLADADRRVLEEFFHERIEAARQDLTPVPWQEHLMEALDYRLWHRFRIQRRVPGETSWSELTRHGHAASSGGEKAVALHLPLFAAAAAHYHSARKEAPRLILLDEAFAGIDAGMRGRCMGLLVDFDLDFMMTSHDEWGCYEELPGVATYQLYRDPTLGGVATVRCVWNGERLEEEDEG